LTDLAAHDYGVMEKDELDYDWDWDACFFGRGLLLLSEFDRSEGIIWRQSAFKFDPVSASNFEPFERRVLTVALASSELAGVTETWPAWVV
jgi:hypothetical protein